MKKIILLFCLIIFLSIPTTSFGWGLEFAGGGWYQKPGGDMSFDKSTNADDLDLENNLNYDDLDIDAKFQGPFAEAGLEF